MPEQLEALNQAEDVQYGECDPEETGEKVISKQSPLEEIEKMNKVIEKTADKRQRRKIESLKKKVRNKLKR